MKKIFTLIILMIGVQLAAQPAGWTFNQPITISNPNTVNAVDYQVKITVNTQSLISANKMTVTGSDIRFGGACTGSTFYNYWIESGINTAATVIWIKVPLIAAGTSSTVFMFYGNTSALATSSIQGTFRGPNSSTDSVTTTVAPGGLSINQRGFRFSPNQNLLVTHFGKNEPSGTNRYITLFNYATQAILSQTQVAGPAATYTYGPIQSPLWLSPGTQYVLQIYGIATDAYYFAPSTQIGQHLTYIDMQYSNGGTQNTFPTNTLAGYHYGYGDFLYYVTNTLAITPTYTLGGSLINITGASSPICAGNTVTLTTNATGTYSWNTGVSTSSIVVSPTGNTTYSVVEFNMSGCNSAALITVTVNQGLPTLTVVNTAVAGGICPTKTVILTASGANTYTWTGGSLPVTNGVVFAPVSAADYTITGGNGCGTVTAVTSVSVHPFPTINPVASSSSLCSGSSVTLTATGTATNYAWSGGSGGISNGVGFSPVLTATYTVIGTSALSCTASATVPVTVVTTPVIPPTSSTVLNCVGNSVTLTAIGATNYTWTSATQTVFTSTLLATLSATGISTYTVTKANSNCIDVKTISITTNPLPTIFAIVSPTLVCASNPATLAVGGGQTYTWTAPGTPTTSFNGAAPVVYPLAPSIYTVAASDGTCINRTTVSLAVNPNPTITIVPTSSTICDGQSVTLNANGGINYTWTSTSGATFNNTLTITESPTTTVAYNITGDNSFGCISGASQVVLVNPNPTLTIAANRTLVCSGSPALLTGNGADTYTWTLNGALTRTTTVNPVSLLSGPEIYSVAGSYTTGCSSSKTIAINVYVPVLTVSGNTNTCAGGLLSLSGAGGNAGTYVWNTGTSSSNFQTLTTTLSAAGIFTLSATSTSITTNCPATKTIAVGIYFNPTITAVAQRTTICNKESVQLYGDGGVSYTWNNAMQGGTITVSPVAQTNYTVTGTDANGCVSTGTVQVKVSGCVGINELANSANGLLIYPNPSNGEFTIEAARSLSLSLINEMGQTIRTLNLSGSNNYKVSVSDLAKGIYFITDRNEKIHQKIIVTK